MAILERAEPYTPFFVADFSGSFVTASVNCADYSSGSVHLTWSGLDALTGTAKLEVSNDNSNWNVLGGADATTDLDATPESQVWAITTINYEWIRLRYINVAATTGSGSVFFSLRQ